MDRQTTVIKRLAWPWSISYEHEPGRPETSKSGIDLDLVTVLNVQSTEIEAVPVSPGFPRNGSYPVPDRPGLGFTLNHDAVKRHLVREQSFS